jgi:hypothetical protein
VQVEVVPGGSWATPKLAAAFPSFGYALPALAPVTTPGTDSALMACSPQGFCVVVVSVGGSVLQMSGDDIGRDAVIAAAAPIIARVVAAG